MSVASARPTASCNHAAVVGRCVLATSLVALFACSDASDSPSRNAADTHVDYAAAKELSPDAITFVCSGGADDDAGCLRRQIDALATSEDGTILVATPDPGQLLSIFPSGGRNARTLGRTGMGPGEYQFPIAGEFIPGEGTAIVDAARMRAIFYDANDEYVSERPLPDITFGLRGLAILNGDVVAFRQGRRKTATGSAPDISPGNAQSSAPSTVTIAVVRYGEQRIDTLVVRDITDLTANDEGMVVQTAYSPMPRWGLRRDGSVVFIDGRESIVQIYDQATGWRRIVINKPPVPVTSADRSAAEEKLQRMPMPPGGASRRDEQIAMMVAMLPTQHPAFGELVIGADGSIWLAEPRIPGRTSVRWDVLSPAGESAGYIMLPAGVRIVGGISATRVLVAGDIDGEGGDLLAWYELQNPSSPERATGDAQGGVGRQ